MAGLEQEVDGVRYPDVRENIISAIRGLSNRDYQRRVWVMREMPPNVVHDDFALAIEILYDLAGLRDDTPETWVGVILCDKKEAELADAVMTQLDGVLGKYGSDKTDEEYINCPEWPRVIAASQQFMNYVNEK